MYDPDSLCFTVDVEWAHPAVLEDLCALFDDAGVTATFFATHAGVSVPGHERGLHPNFRWKGDTGRAVRESDPEVFSSGDEASFYRSVVKRSMTFAPEAKGLRAHSLFSDSALAGIYREAGLEFDCTHQMSLVENLRPFFKQRDMLEIPTFYGDHFDLMAQATGFQPGGIRLDRSGLKVLDFHPNIVFTNAPDEAFYLGTKAFYHDPQRLLAARHPGRGVRTLLMELLECVGAKGIPISTVGRINQVERGKRAQA
ncbi:hypothetical protein [Fundidesulfovibrio agrisoli]|uniref:polysaccharide deacetylase WbmS family protein n=1 Tax=Fundidesulfovibrio agrisoli TaxID=2922717 RepID=UPI001FAC3826|nr:hypothetical protein [Fundidesulfovibrio agrisoli]